jgi:hypothetical protein
MSDLLDTLHLRPMPGRLAPDERLVRGFEDRFGVALPVDYRAFLLAHGGSYTSAKAPFSVPTPIGTDAMVEELFGFMEDEHDACDLRNAAETAGSAPNVIPIACDGFGNWTLLVCRGRHTGSVLHEDMGQRALWSDAEFHQRFPNLAPSIEHYLALRRAAQLPPSIVSGPNCYLLAPSFEAFLASWSPLD